MTDAPSPPDPRVGSVIQDRYKILDVIASGGMGIVYRGERLQLGRPVAIKFLHPSVASQRSFLQRFEVEARAMSRLAHPNCVSVIDFGVDGVPFLVMDFIGGRSLRALMASDRLEPNRALGLVRQILSGLAHAHAQGIVHRDLKPDNIIVSDSPGLMDHVRILDFGLAKLRDGPALTVGMAVGTPSYMAPEQTQAEGVIGPATDVYAVGVLLFEMLAGRKPFVADNLADVILMHQSKPAPRLAAVAIGATFSEALEGFVAKALAKAPADRFSGADEMAAALEHIPESASSLPAVPQSAAAARAVDGGAGTDGPPTVADQTLVDVRRHSPAAPVAEGAKPPPALGWRRWLRPLPRRWTRPWWIAAGVSAGAMLVLVLAWMSSRSHGDRPAAPTPPAAPRAAQPSPAVIDELAPMSPDDTPGLADAAQLVRLGLREQAIVVLQDIRRKSPRSAYANFLLAVVYVEKLWWSVGLQHAEMAIQADPAYRRSPKLAKLFVSSLMSDSFWEKAGAFLERELPEVCVPYLQDAAQTHKSARVRARAAQILASERLRAGGSNRLR